MAEDPTSSPAWWRDQTRLAAFVVIASATIVLVGLLKHFGLILAAILAISLWVFTRSTPEGDESQSLRASIALSAEDIRDVIAEFDAFAYGTDADAIADRTLRRPALIDLDFYHEDIDAFHFQYSSSQRFLRRLAQQLRKPTLAVADLEHLLEVTDNRAAELRESWLLARRTAFRLGPNYLGNYGPPAPEGLEGPDSPNS